MLKFLLFFNLLFDVNELHFQFLQTGIPAVAPINIIFLLIIWAMRNKPETALGPEVRGLLREPLLIWFGMITIGIIISELRGVDNFLEDITYYKNALFYPLYYFIYLRSRQDEKTTRWLIIWIMVIAAVAGLEGLREGLDYGFGKYRPDKRASGPFGTDWRNSNRAGVFYAMFMPMFISFALFLRNKRILWRLSAVGGCILLAGGAISTYSRQAYGLIVLGLALLLVRKNIVIAALVAVMAGTLVTYLPDAATQRVEETSQNNKAHGDVDTSTASRWEIWAAGMDMLKEHPIGVGFHKFSFEIGNYSSQYRGYDAHNFYVLTLCETGPQTLIAFFFVIFTLFRIASFVRRSIPADDPEGQALGLGFTITTLCMAMGGLYGSPIFEGPVMGPYWALCGLLERYAHMKMMGVNTTGGDAPPPEPSLVERFPLAAHILPGKARP